VEPIRVATAIRSRFPGIRLAQESDDGRGCNSFDGVAKLEIDGYSGLVPFAHKTFPTGGGVILGTGMDWHWRPVFAGIEAGSSYPIVVYSVGRMAILDAGLLLRDYEDMVRTFLGRNVYTTDGKVSTFPYPRNGAPTVYMRWSGPSAPIKGAPKKVVSDPLRHSFVGAEGHHHHQYAQVVVSIAHARECGAVVWEGVTDDPGQVFLDQVRPEWLI
jgi:hypothetical protein